MICGRQDSFFDEPKLSKCVRNLARRLIVTGMISSANKESDIDGETLIRYINAFEPTFDPVYYDFDFKKTIDIILSKLGDETIKVLRSRCKNMKYI